MTTTPTSLEKGARAVAREVAPWVEALARFGHAAKGVVYALVGAMALCAALGDGRTTDKAGALREVDRIPFGDALLAGLALGFAGFALWRFVQTVFDPDRHGSDAPGLALRLRALTSGIGYATLSVTSWELFTDDRVEVDGDGTRLLTAKILDAPAGELLVGAAGAGLCAYGVHELYRAVSGRFLDKLDLAALSKASRTLIGWIGRLGVAAHGVVLGLTGAFLVRAALEQRAHHARGLGGALRSMAATDAGPPLLVVVAVGLLAYSALVLLEVRCRKMKLSPRPA